MIIQGKRVRKNPEGRGRLHGGAIAVCILMTAVLLALLPASGGAHPPKEVVLTYDQARQTVEVRITHSVSDPAKHFIEKVEIKKAGKTILKTDYKSQPDPATFVYVYPVEFGSGDVIEVKVSCSVFGSKTESLDMRKTPR
jgi:hypothetical protein